MAPDVDVVNVRRLIRKAFVSPVADGQRVGIAAQALLYPL
jgi:hypothetical protein